MAHWSEVREKSGSVWQMRLLYNLYKGLGPKGLKPWLSFVVFFYWAFSPSARRSSREFLSAVREHRGEDRPKVGDVLRHFQAFAYSLFEKLAAWSGQLKVEDLIPIGPDLNSLVQSLEARQGAVILCSHLGNIEVLRALGSLEAGRSLPAFGIHSIVDFSGTSRFNEFLKEINPRSMVKLVSASAMGADTIIALKEALNQGDLVIIAADRTAKANRGRSGQTRFLGRTAWFPLGSLILASLMEAPVYHMFAVRVDDLDPSSPYEFHVCRSQISFQGSRKDRMAKIQDLLDEYVAHLERLCLNHPYQWYNFFNFWQPPQGASAEGVS